MKLFNKKTKLKKVKSYISVFIIFFFINNLMTFGSENKSVFIKSKNIDNELEEAFFKNSIPFSQYDNSESQLKLLFGRWRDPNQNANIFYPDFPIPKNSDSLREIYKSKLNDMKINDHFKN